MNYSTIEDLAWAIAAGEGEFSLTFAHCNYVKWRDNELIQQLQSQCDIASVRLEAGDINLYQKIEEKIKRETPSSLMVVGLETVENLPQFLTKTNQLREKFRADFKFPLVFWVTDFILGEFTEFAMDFKTFGGTIYLPISPEALQEDLEYKINRFFDEFLAYGGSQFIPNEKILGKSYRQEIDAALADSQQFGQELTPYIKGCLALIRGRDEYAVHKLDAISHYQQTQDYWQNCSDVSPLQQAVLEFHFGLCFGEKYDTAAREQAKTHLKTCIEILETQKRPDLVAKFINNLGEVLLKLEDWSELKTLAEKAIPLQEEYEQYLELAQAYGFLAQVALKDGDWQDACDNANLGLHISRMGNAPVRAPAPVLAPNVIAPNPLLYLLLAQGEEQLGNHKDSWTNCEVAIEFEIDGQPHYFLKLLRELRDLYFKNAYYLEAYKTKIEIQRRKQQYGLTAFVGAGRLKASKTQDLALFGRQRDVENIVEKIARKDNKLIILYGESGVGKSSLVEAGLVPALQRKKLIDNREIVVVNLRVYTNWEEELLESLGTPQPSASPLANGGLRWALQDNDQNYRFTVLIFDQFEEFFFVVKDAAARRQFFDFLVECLNQSYVKVVLSLREDYLHLILQGTRRLDLSAINNDVLDKNILYYIGNFSTDAAIDVIQRLTQPSQFQLEDELIKQLVADLAKLGEVRPIELQIIGAQLQQQEITTIAAYKKKGIQAKNELLKQYVKDIIEDCGSDDNKEIAKILLYLLTEENLTRPLKNKTDLKHELSSLAIHKKIIQNNFEVILKILLGSGLVVEIPEKSSFQYQLVHDYLVNLIRQQQKDSEIDRVTKQSVHFHNSLIQSLTRFSQSLIKNKNTLSGLVEAIRAVRQLQEQPEQVKTDTKMQLTLALFDAADRVREKIPFFSSQTLEDHDSSVTMVVFSPDGETLASGSGDKTIKLWSREGTLLHTLKSHQSSVTAVVFSLNGETLASGSRDNTIKLWSLEGKLLHTLKGHQSSVRTVVFSPDGQTLASGSNDKTIKLWSLEGKLLHTLKGHQSPVRTVVFSPDGETLASGSRDKTIKLWTREGTLLHTLKSHQSSVRTVVFSPDGETLASGSDDKTIKLWSLEGKLLNTLNAHQDSVSSVVFSPDGQTIASGSDDKTIKLWSREGKLLNTLNAHQDSVSSVVFSPDGQTIASGSDDKTIKLWSREGKLLNTLNAHQDSVSSVVFSPDGQTIASGSDDKTIKLWSPGSREGKLLHTLNGHQSSVLTVAFSPDRQIFASGSHDKTIKLWNREGELLHTLNGHQSSVETVAFSPDRQIFASGSDDKTIKLWSLEGKLLHTLKGHQNWVYTVAFSPDGETLASGSGDHTIKLWSLEGKLLHTLNGHEDWVYTVAFSPDRQIFASGSYDKTIKLWSRKGKLLHTLKGHQNWVYTVAFSPNGQTIASGSDDKTIKLWSLEGKLLHTLEGHQSSVYTVVFSRDGQTIASGSDDKTIKLWSLEGKLLHTLNGHQSSVYTVVFSPDGETLASGSRDGKIILWNLDLDDLLVQGCNWARDYLNYSAEVSESDRGLCNREGR